MWNLIFGFLLVYIDNLNSLQVIDALVTVRVATEMPFRFDLNPEARRLGLAASCR